MGPRLRVLVGRLHQRHSVLRHAPAVLAKLAGHTDATTMVVLHGPHRTSLHRGPARARLATPFFEGPQVAGSVTLTIPQFRKDELDLPRLTAALGATAARITALLTV